MSDEPVAFFGCWAPGQFGHFIYDSSGRTLRSFGPFVPESLDGVLLKPGHRIRGQVDVRCFKDYTVLAFEDYTVDRRPGSNAAFIVEGSMLTASACWTAAEAHYPQIVERLRGHVRMER